MKDIIIPFSLLILAQFIWAISWLFTKKLINIFSPFLVYVIEAIIIGILVLPFIFYYRHDFIRFSKENILWVIIACTLAAAGGIIYFFGFKNVSFIAASLSALTFPLFAILLGAIFLHESLTIKFFIAAALMIAGFLVLVL